MYKVEKMHIAEIMEQTNLFLTLKSLYNIWKDSEENLEIPGRPSAAQLLRNKDFASKIIDDDMAVYTFLIEHDGEIDKISFLLTLFKNYEERLKQVGNQDITASEIEGMHHGIGAIKKLLKGIDKTYVYYETDKRNQKITHLTILNTKDVVTGTDRKNKNSNNERLQEVQKDIYFGNIIQSILPADLQYIIAFDPEIGAEMRNMIEYNVALEENNFNTKGKSLKEAISEIPRTKFIKETIRVVEQHIEELNFDKLLLCSAYRFLEQTKQDLTPKEHMPKVKLRLEIIKTHIKKNARIELKDGRYFSVRDIEQELARFVGTGENVSYLLDEDIEQLTTALLEGEISLTGLGIQNFEAISLEKSKLAEILQKDPNNYIFLLKHDKCTQSKDRILNDIINAKKCSTDLLCLLCDKMELTAEEICDLFEREIISVSDLKCVREEMGAIITHEKLFEKYREYKENAGNEDARTQLERYALAYRNTELAGKTPEQIQEKGEEFITEVGEEIELRDLVPLYSLDVIPLKVAVDWGGENIIEELLESESLKPLDAKHLRNEGLLDETVLERLFQKCATMSYSYQISLVYAVFDGQTQEEQKIRENLAQYYHIENGIINSSGNNESGKRKRGFKSEEQGESKRTIRMRDPGAKYNLLASIDKDVKIEEGIIDGHIIFHYPNIDEGIVLIEKLHRITSNRENGITEIRADNQSATYVMSEEEFIKMKSQLIQDGRIDRTQLTQRWWVTRDPEHWIPHTGAKGWEYALKERFLLNHENQRYSSEELKIIEELIAKSIESKKKDEDSIDK